MSLSFLLPSALPSCLLIYTILRPVSFVVIGLSSFLYSASPHSLHFLLFRSHTAFPSFPYSSFISSSFFLSFLPSFRWSFIASPCALCILSILKPFPSISPYSFSHSLYFPPHSFILSLAALAFFCFLLSSFNVSWHVETMKCHPCQAHPPPAVCFCVSRSPARLKWAFSSQVVLLAHGGGNTIKLSLIKCLKN